MMHPSVTPGSAKYIKRASTYNPASTALGGSRSLITFVYIKLNKVPIRCQGSCVMDSDIVFSAHIGDTHFGEIHAIFIQDFDDPPREVDITAFFIDVNVDTFPKHNGAIVWIHFLRRCIINGFSDGFLVCFANIVIGGGQIYCSRWYWRQRSPSLRAHPIR